MSLAGTAVGSGERDVVLVHGWMMASSALSGLAGRLVGTGRTVWSVDQRGAGDSDAPASGYGIAQYAADLAVWIERLGLRRPTIVAHSMGGQIAQVLAARYPERVGGLILLNPVPAAGLSLPEAARALFASSAGDREKQGIILDLATLRLAPDAREALLDAAATVSVGCIQESLAAFTAGGFAGELSAISATTHVVATSDPFLPADFLAAAVVALIRGAHLHHLPGSGHYSFAEDPERIAALVGSLIPA